MEPSCRRNLWRNGGVLAHALNSILRITKRDKVAKLSKNKKVSTLPAMPPDTKKCNGAVPRVPPPTSAPAAPAAAVPTPALASASNGTHCPRTNSRPGKRSISDYYVGKTLGEGSFSTVWLVRDIHTRKDYALKQCSKAHILREHKTECIKREKQVLNILSETGAPFCVKLYCTFQDATGLYFLITYAKNGELLTHINRSRGLSVDCTRFYAAELVVALEHFRKLNIIHLDLKPENILLDENMHILITDLGCAKFVQSDASDTNASTETQSESDRSDGSDSDDEDLLDKFLKTRRPVFIGTPQYLSPEMITHRKPTCSCDLWALGCIIYQMLTNKLPFKANSEFLIFQKILNLEYEFPEDFDPTAEDLIRKLLVLKPTSRLGASDKEGYPSIRSHPFFANTPWDCLASTQPPTIYSDPTNQPPPHNDNWVTSNMRPGLDNSQLSRILGLDQGSASPEEPPPQQSVPRRKKSCVLDLTEPEIQQRLALQKKQNKWHNVVDGNLIIKQGVFGKRKMEKMDKGVFTKTNRMMLLTLGPHLYYADPDSCELKGEFDWTSDLKVRPQSFKSFFLHCGLKGEVVYNLEQSDPHALEWLHAIDDMHQSVYGVRALTT